MILLIKNSIDGLKGIANKMERVTINYECVPTFNNINAFIQGCYLEPHDVYCKTGEWVVLEGTTYADNIPYDTVEHRASGLGIFIQADDEKPFLIFDHQRQTVYILYSEFINRLSAIVYKINKKIEFFAISYDRAFGDVFDMNNFLSEVEKKEMSNETN